MMFFPAELETYVYGKEKSVHIQQRSIDGVYSEVVLTLHQFNEMVNREKSIIAEADEEQEDEE